jgi:hypothetical protein
MDFRGALDALNDISGRAVEITVAADPERRQIVAQFSGRLEPGPDIGTGDAAPFFSTRLDRGRELVEGFAMPAALFRRAHWVSEHVGDRSQALAIDLGFVAIIVQTLD